MVPNANSTEYLHVPQAEDEKLTKAAEPHGQKLAWNQFSKTFENNKRLTNKHIEPSKNYFVIHRVLL